MLQIDDLTVRYGAVEAVSGLGLEVTEGTIVALLGANGAGKTSTLSAITGLVPGRSGSVRLAGEELIRLAPETIVTRGIALCPEGRRVFSSLTIDDNLLLGGATLEREERRLKRDEMLSLFPILAERRNQAAGTLSGGEQQQLAIARALMSKPKLLLLDEPSLGLAPKIVEDIFDLILRLRHSGVTVLLVEQNVAMALEISDRGYVMANGRIVLADEAEALRHSGAVTHAYLGGTVA